ncbi:MAG: hypothetical protein K2X94_00625 [Amoebophilaceae bacterium]|nr:hypothetical protein [Amoebophilaceae bacterium]
MHQLRKYAVYNALGLFIAVIVSSWSFKKKSSDESLHNTDGEHQKSAVCLASVNGQCLYDTDLENLHAISIDATADRFSQHIENWAFKKLLIMEGEKQAQFTYQDRQINQYKDDLFAYAVLQKMVKSELNEAISSDVIIDYYQNHQNEFVLNHDIVKGLFLAIPKHKKVRGINHLKSLMLSNPVNLSRLKEYSKAYPDTSILEPDRWFPWEDVLVRLKFIPRNATRLLQANKFIDVAGEAYLYLLKIDQYKLSQALAPLELVQERIKAIILHKRRLVLEKQIKDKLLLTAKKNRVYVNHVA